MDQDCSDRAVDAARKPANHAARPDLFADLGNLGRAKFGHRPVARKPADFVDEIGDQLCPIGRMRDFGVELRAIIAALVIGDQREGCAVRSCNDTEAGGELGHLVAMAHPHLVPLTHLPQAVKQYALLGDGQEGTAEFAAFTGFMPGAHFAAQLVAHHLLAIADAKDRQARVKQALRRARTAIFGY